MLRSNLLKLILPALLACSGLAMATSPNDQIPAPPQKQPIALMGGTVHTVSGAVLTNVTILFDKGKITAIGKNVELPANTLRVDATGKHIYPTLIEVNSTLGLTEIGAVSSTRDFAEIGGMNPSVRAEVAINPDSELIPVARSNGVGIALSSPTGGTIAGKAALIMLDGWTWEDMTLKSSAGMVMNWPSMRVRTGWRSRTPADRQRENMKKQLQAMDDIFDQARAYKTAMAAADKDGVPAHKRDVRLEGMIPVLDGDVPMWINANDIKQIRAAVDWASKQNIKMVLNGGTDAWMALDLLKHKDVPVVVSPLRRPPSRRYEPFDTQFTLPKKLHEAEIDFCIAAGKTGMGNDRNLPYFAAKAAAYGLPKDVALKSVTLYSARILGVDDQIGSLEVGKDASLIITNGDPLEITTQVEKLYLQGRDIDLGDKQKELFEKYRKKYEKEAPTPATSD